MDLAALKPWLVYLHVIGVILFFLAHGVAATIAFRVRTERDPVRLRAMLDLSASTIGALYGTLLLLLVSGVVAGFAGPNWWTSGRLWLWVSVGLLIVVVAAMYVFMTGYFSELRRAVGAPTAADLKAGTEPPPPVDAATLEQLLTSSRPLIGIAFGLGGILLITWLMLFKPF